MLRRFQKRHVIGLQVSRNVRTGDAWTQTPEARRLVPVPRRYVLLQLRANSFHRDFVATLDSAVETVFECAQRVRRPNPLQLICCFSRCVESSP
jgi:hypothetical protein